MSYVGNETFLLLGGGGMVGQEIAYEIARELNPKRIIVCALSFDLAKDTVRKVKKDFKNAKLRWAAGDIFVRHEWNSASGRNAVSREDMLVNDTRRQARYDDTFGKLEQAYPHSELVWLIENYAPDVIIDSINTATAISYQDVYSRSYVAKETLDKLKASLREPKSRKAKEAPSQTQLIESSIRAAEEVIISQSIPQLVRHVLLIDRAMREQGTRLYLKVGTTGTGGMGLNIPYTHSEESPSATLMEKTAVAFAQTGLLYLMARTLGGPAVKEFKPAAMIGYADIGYRTLKANAVIGTQGKNVKLYISKTEPIRGQGTLRLRPSSEDDLDYEAHRDLKLPVVNTGENGFFTKGEFQAITAMRQMEFITPEEIARQVVLEIKGSNTGYDVIAAIDSASMNPSYRAGYLRRFAIDELKQIEDVEKVPSVAFGALGPPELGKLLWEAYLLHTAFKKKERRDNELHRVISESKESIAEKVDKLVTSDENLRNTIVSVGFPILRPDGKSLIRGPYLRIPERKNDDTTKYQRGDIDKWARKGWIDLRIENMDLWRHRFIEMQHKAKSIAERGSAAFTREAYLWDDIRIGVVVAWIFNNELDEQGRLKFGYRIK